MLCIVWFWKKFDADDQQKKEACAGAAATIGAGEALASICLAGAVAAGWTEAGAGACACASNVGADAAGLRSWADPVAPVVPVASAVGALHTCKCLRCVDGGIMIVWYDMTNLSDMSCYATWNFNTTWVTRRHPEPQTSVTNFSACQYEMGVKVLNSACFERRPRPHGVFSANDQLFHWCFGYAPPPKQFSQITQTRTQIEMHLLSLLHVSYVSKKSVYDFWICWPLAHWPWVLISSPTYRPCGQWRSTFHCAPAKLEVFGKCEYNVWTHIARWHMYLSNQTQPRFSLGPSLEASRSFPQPEITAKVEKVHNNPGGSCKAKTLWNPLGTKISKRIKKTYLAISVEKKLGSSGGCLASMHARF